MEIEYANRFSALAHPQRIAVLRLLLRRFPDDVPAGEVAEALSLKPNTLSPYLAALLNAGFVTQRRVGTSLRYAADPDGLGGLIDGFIAECCQGRPDLCRPSRTLIAKEDPMTFRILFICTGNSARSIFAESILSSLGGDRFEVLSAGPRPASALNPLALQL